MRVLQPGETIDGRYVLDEPIASGGFGTVWAARHHRTDQFVAIKVLHATRSTAQEGAVERFLREVKITSSLRHPNTVRVFDFGGGGDGDNDPPLYLVMERLHGPNLEDVLRSLKVRRIVMSEAAAIDIALPVLGSLAEAHASGLVHRDLKPGNIILNEVSGNVPVVKVLDFGCSYVRGSTLTDEGAVFGTLGYMSPEQIRGAEVDGRSDLFALGLILYRAVTGEMPFDALNNVTLLYKYASQNVPDPRTFSSTQISDAFAETLMKSLALSAGDRFAGAAEMRTAFEKIRSKVRARPAFADSELSSVVRRTEIASGGFTISGELGALVRVALEVQSMPSAADAPDGIEAMVTESELYRISDQVDKPTRAYSVSDEPRKPRIPPDPAHSAAPLAAPPPPAGDGGGTSEDFRAGGNTLSGPGAVVHVMGGEVGGATLESLPSVAPTRAGHALPDAAHGTPLYGLPVVTPEQVRQKRASVEPDQVGAPARKEETTPGSLSVGWIAAIVLLLAVVVFLAFGRGDPAPTARAPATVAAPSPPAASAQPAAATTGAQASGSPAPAGADHDAGTSDDASGAPVAAAQDAGSTAGTVAKKAGKPSSSKDDRAKRRAKKAKKRTRPAPRSKVAKPAPPPPPAPKIKRGLFED